MSKVVYVVTNWDYAQTAPVAVYSTEAAAKAFCDEHNKGKSDWGGSYGFDPFVLNKDWGQIT